VEEAFADNATLDDMATAVAANSGWSATVSGGFANYPSDELLVTPALSTKDRAINLEVMEDGETDYEISNAAMGELYHPYGWAHAVVERGMLAKRFEHGVGYYGRSNNIFVDYTAGFTRENIPEPIKSACLELVAFTFRSTKTDPTKESEKIGDYSYKIRANMDAFRGSIQSKIRESGLWRPMLYGA
jgi:hypothetical protein